jgi:hypothetical protein
MIYNPCQILLKLSDYEIESGGHVARMEQKMHTGFLWKHLKEGHLEDLGVDCSLILEWVLTEIGWKSSGSGQRQVADCYEPSGFFKCGKFTDYK